MGYADPYSFQTYKFAAAALAVALLFPRQLVRLRGRTVGWGLLLAGPLFAGNTWLTLRLPTTRAANAAFLTGLSVLLVPLGKALLYRQAVAPKMGAACALALLGLYVVAVQGGWHLHAGDGWVIAGAFAGCVLLGVREPHLMAVLVAQPLPVNNPLRPLSPFVYFGRLSRVCSRPFRGVRLCPSLYSSQQDIVLIEQVLQLLSQHQPETDEG